GEIEPGLTETGTYDPPGTFSDACHAAIVEGDVETGHVTVERYIVAEDAGRIINPMIARHLLQRCTFRRSRARFRHRPRRWRHGTRSRTSRVDRKCRFRSGRARSRP